MASRSSQLSGTWWDVTPAEVGRATDIKKNRSEYHRERDQLQRLHYSGEWQVSLATCHFSLPVSLPQLTRDMACGFLPVVEIPLHGFEGPGVHGLHVGVPVFELRFSR
jgi:hypothetical protein